MRPHHRITKSIVALLTVAFLMFQGCEEMQNTPPKILSLPISDENVALGEKVRITCIAEDEYPEELSYTWTCTKGYFLDGDYETYYFHSRNENESIWLSTNQAGIAEITCKVEDKYGETDEMKVTVYAGKKPVSAILLPESPEGYFQKGKSIIITVEVGQHEHPVREVELFSNDLTIGSMSTPPYIFEWQTGTFDYGLNELKVRVTDSREITGESYAEAYLDVFVWRKYNLIDSNGNEIYSNIYYSTPPVFFDKSTAYIIVDGDLLRSEDGGNTWEKKSELAYDRSPPYKIFIKNRETLYVTSNGNPFYLISEDGGTTLNHIKYWEEGAIVASGDPEMIWTNEKIGWASRESNFYEVTYNGGATWETRQSAGGAIHKFFFITEFIGWSVGSNIMKTTDGGDTWTIQNSDFYSRDAYFLDKNQGWVLGYNSGTILHTIDGGLTWNEQTIGSKEVMYQLYFKTALEGIALGTDRIYHTFDGGTTWKPAPYPKFNYQTRLSVIPGKNIFFTGGLYSSYISD